MIKVGILGAAGYTGGELIRLLLNHPEAEIVFANSESNAGNLVSDVHEGLIGDTDLKFTDEMPFDKVDVVFFCFGHGKSEAFLKEHTIPENVKIIDLAQDFRIKGDHDYVYGLPEINKEDIMKAQHVANPGCFATCIQVALLPAAYLNLLKEDVAVNGWSYIGVIASIYAPFNLMKAGICCLLYELIFNRLIFLFMRKSPFFQKWFIGDIFYKKVEEPIEEEKAE